MKKFIGSASFLFFCFMFVQHVSFGQAKAPASQANATALRDSGSTAKKKYSPTTGGACRVTATGQTGTYVYDAEDGTWWCRLKNGHDQECSRGECENAKVKGSLPVSGTKPVSHVPANTK